MNGRERVTAMLTGAETDRLPLMPITMMFAADRIGAKYRDYARDHRVLAEAQIATAEAFGLDYVSAISDPAHEASDLGAEIQWFDDQPPATFEALGSIDLIFLAGGGIIGHPSGPKAGVRSLVEAWQAAVEGVPLDAYARNRPALREALAAFGSRAKD